MSWRGAAALALLGAVATLAQVGVHAQPKGATTPAPPVAEEGPSWSSLQPAQRQALQPLQRDWAGIDAMRKRKWLEIADRYPGMSPQDQARLQNRMTDWARMSPNERSQARLQFQEAKRIPASERAAGWEAYRALPPDERNQLAGKAAAAPAAGSSAAATGARPSSLTPPERRGRESAQRKPDQAPAPTPAADPKALTPSVVQAKPGATTTLITKPPPPQATAGPKIAATPEYVDKKTLLPQAGAQRAAVARPAGASAP